MLSKGSVKKPYTVVIGLILVLVLGAVSFSRLTSDLLPNFNLPYVMVLTAYPGASPSQIEETVTRPVEQSMASVTNVNDMQSVSQDNLSTVILQFSTDTDMDSVSLEMREKLDQVRSELPESVNDPMIVKMNPDMIPVYVAAVQKDGATPYELNNYVRDELSSGFESIEGVASAETSGGVTEFIQVVLNQERVDDLNDNIKEAVLDQFSDGEKELDDAIQKLDDTQKELDDGKNKFETGKEEAASQAGSAHGEIVSGQNELILSEAELKSNIALLQSKQQDLEQQRQELVSNRDTLQSTLNELNKIPGMIEELTAQKQQIDASVLIIQKYLSDPELVADAAATAQTVEEMMSRYDELTEEEKEQLTLLSQKLAGYQAELLPLGVTITDEAGTLKSLNESLAKFTGLKAQVETTLEELTSQYDEGTVAELQTSLSQVEAGIAAVDEGLRQINGMIGQLQSAQAQIDSGKASLSEAVSALNMQEINGVIELAEAAAQVSVGESQLESARTQLDSTKESLEDQKQAALDQADISAQVSISMLTQVLTAQHFSMPAGYAKEGKEQYLVRVGNKAENIEELRDIVLFDPGLDGIEPVRLKDVALVEMTDDSGEVYAKINGQDGILIQMQKQTDASTGDVAGRIEEHIRDIEKADPSVHITTLMNEGEYIDIIVNSVLQNLFFGAILAVIVLLLFLKDIRPTLVVACSIPLSVLCAIILMYFSGVTLNVISLSGLALAVGMLVDNSIVVIENIYRLRSLGMPVRKAAVQGAKQMTGAIIASTLTTVCVFIPIIFTNGLARQLFVDLSLTVTYSLLASLIIAMTFVPMASAGLLKTYTMKRNRLFERLSTVYEKSLRFSLSHKLLIFILAIALFVVSMFSLLQRGMQLLPDMEATQATVTMTMNHESTVRETGEMADKVMDRLASIDEITDVGGMVASSSSDGSVSLFLGNTDENTATLYIIMDEHKKRSNEEIQKEIEEKTADLDCTVTTNMTILDYGAILGDGISLQVKGRDPEVLRKIAEDISGIMREIDGLVDIDDGLQDTTEELLVSVNKEKAAAYDLTVAQVYQLISEKLSENSGTVKLDTDTDEYDIVLYDAAFNEYSRADIRKLKIDVTDQEGGKKTIPLSDIATFSGVNGFETIQRINQSRVITLTAAVGEDANITLVSDELIRRLEDYEFPDGYSYEMTGEDESIRDALKDMIFMLLLGFVLMYLIMTAQFQSFKSPFIVMFTVPLAFTGGFLALLITGNVISIIALLGFLMLSGVIVNNGIVLVDYVNQLRAAGKEKTEALVLAGKARLRPILMTALTTILGLLTMAFGFGAGADMAQPMAIVTIGGLLYGTVMTLLVVPCLYDIMNRKEIRVVSDEELEATGDDLDLMDETNEIL